MTGPYICHNIKKISRAFINTSSTFVSILIVIEDLTPILNQAYALAKTFVLAWAFALALNINSINKLC